MRARFTTVNCSREGGEMLPKIVRRVIIQSNETAEKNG